MDYLFDPYLDLRITGVGCRESNFSQESTLAHSLYTAKLFGQLTA
jgi:hypothetical protein